VLLFCRNLSADDLVITEKSFGCVLDLPKVRNTRIQNPDPEKLKEAIRIFPSSVPDTEYPGGTILQLIPTEAMVKHDRSAFPKTNGWEFFALTVSPGGTTIQERGDKVINTSLKKPCLDCHSPAAKFDFVREQGHGCATIPVTDEQIAAMQAGDPLCKKVKRSMARLELSRSPVLCFRRNAGSLDQRLPAGAKSLRLAAWAGLQDSSPRAALLSIHARVEDTGSTSWEHPSLAQLCGHRFSDYAVPAKEVAVFSLGRLHP
jgi:hypothetical protein